MAWKCRYISFCVVEETYFATGVVQMGIRSLSEEQQPY